MIYYKNAENMSEIQNESIDLIVTSPPYPMIEIWDTLFSKWARSDDLAESSDIKYQTQLYLLDKVWRECVRVLKYGGLLCINIGDACRSIEGNFQLFSTSANITTFISQQLDMVSLIPILWKKPTNKPNAFLGSGFIPTNGYVTLDCEYILIFSKGNIRKFPPKDPNRYASEFTKEERDVWFSQIWNIKGTSQKDGLCRFPEEIPYRLIRMFSVIGDTVLDPFAGSGTTIKVAESINRIGIGYEINKNLEELL